MPPVPVARSFFKLAKRKGARVIFNDDVNIMNERSGRGPNNHNGNNGNGFGNGNGNGAANCT